MTARNQQADARLDTATRRAFVLDKRRRGMTYARVAKAAVREFGADRLPRGWDALYAYKDVKRELDKAREQCEEEAKALLEIELARLDTAQEAIWTNVLRGSEEAVRAFLGIHDRRAKLLGLTVNRIAIYDWRREASEAGVDAATLFEQLVKEAMDALPSSD